MTSVPYEDDDQRIGGNDTRETYYCPDGGDPAGCGEVFRATKDHEGFVDCPKCGLFFRVWNDRAVARRQGETFAQAQHKRMQEHYCAVCGADMGEARVCNQEHAHSWRVAITETVVTIYEARAITADEAEARATAQHLGPFGDDATPRERHVCERVVIATMLNRVRA